MSGINRFLSRREKHHHGSDGKKEPKQARGGPLHGLFVDDAKQKRSTTEEEKIKVVAQRLADVGIRSFKNEDISFVLAGEYAKGDTDKAYELMAILKDSEEGIIQPYNPRLKLLGAVNRQAVTCYLDSLLFAMFARLSSFEAMLYKNFEDPARDRLATLLRLWVNVLRAGKLITVDITKQIQLQLAECGWKEAAELHQQDASEAFTFITATLALPLLTLKMDIFHFGKEDTSDDHKFINERLLELAIPEESEDGHVITLEECLELFFNNKIEVKRYLDNLERRNTTSSARSRTSMDSTKARALHIEVAQVAEEGEPSTPITPTAPSVLTSPVRPSAGRRRAPSIIQDSYIDEKKRGFGADIDGGDPTRTESRRTRKEVMMPAWQFFSLIPWYTDNVPSNDAQVAAHFSSTRPILGICLKRYYMLNNGQAMKRTTHVDIPLEIGLPHFIQDDNLSEDGPAFGNFKLSLQSVVCHQGTTTESGHYISIVRNPDLDADGVDKWLRFDDLATERVTEVNAANFLKESTSQTPYLLFYQVIPIGGDDGPPPSYADSVGSRDSVIGLLDNKLMEAARPSVELNSNRVSVELSSPDEAPRGRRKCIPSNKDRSSTGNDSAGHSSSNSNPSQTTLPSSTLTDFAIQDASTIRSGLEVPEGATGSGPNSLTASRQGSKTSGASSGATHSNNTTRSKSRETSRSKDGVAGNPASEKRLSASLSRLASRMSRDRLGYNGTFTTGPPFPSTSIPTSTPTPTSTSSQKPTPRQSLEVSRQLSAPAMSDGSSAGFTAGGEAGPAVEVIPAGSSKSRFSLRKDTRDKDKDVVVAGGDAVHQQHLGHVAPQQHHHLGMSMNIGRSGSAGKPDRECSVM